MECSEGKGEGRSGEGEREGEQNVKMNRNEMKRDQISATCQYANDPVRYTVPLPLPRPPSTIHSKLFSLVSSRLLARFWLDLADCFVPALNSRKPGHQWVNSPNPYAPPPSPWQPRFSFRVV